MPPVLEFHIEPKCRKRPECQKFFAHNAHAPRKTEKDPKPEQVSSGQANCSEEIAPLDNDNGMQLSMASHVCQIENATIAKVACILGGSEDRKRRALVRRQYDIRGAAHHVTHTESDDISDGEALSDWDEVANL